MPKVEYIGSLGQEQQEQVVEYLGSLESATDVSRGTPSSWSIVRNNFREPDKAERKYTQGIADSFAFGIKPSTAVSLQEAFNKRVDADPQASAWRQQAQEFVRSVSNTGNLVANISETAIGVERPREEIRAVIEKSPGLTDEERTQALAQVEAGEFDDKVFMPAEQTFYRKSAREKVADMLKGFGAGAIGSIEGFAEGMQWLGGKSEAGRAAKEVADYLESLRMDVAPERPDIFTDIAGGFGSMFTFLIPAVGAELTASRLLGLAPKVARTLSISTMTATESLTESGPVYTTELEKSGDIGKAEKTARTAFFSNLPLLYVTNKFGLFAERAGRMRRFLTSAPMEGTQEAGQEVISQISLGEPVDIRKVGYSGFIGAIVGGGASQLIPAMDKAEAVRDMPGELQGTYDAAVTDGIDKGLPREQAHVEATREIAKTPEGKEYIEQVADAADSVLKAKASMGRAKPAAEAAPVLSDADMDALIQDAEQVQNDEELGRRILERLTRPLKSEEGAVSFERELRQTDVIGGITRTEMGRLIKEGNADVLNYIDRGIEDFGVLRMQDAVRNEIMGRMSRVPRAEREAVRANIRKIQPEINTLLTQRGFINLGSEVSLAPALERLRTLPENSREAIAEIQKVGNSVYAEGKTSLSDFSTRMRDVLGDVWEKFKNVIGQVYEKARAFNERLGQRGEIGRPEDRIPTTTPLEEITDDTLGRMQESTENNLEFEPGSSLFWNEAEGSFGITTTGADFKKVSVRRATEIVQSYVESVYEYTTAKGIIKEKERPKLPLTTKGVIAETTGQAKSEELRKLGFAMRKAAQAAKLARKEGKKEGVEQARRQMKEQFDRFRARQEETKERRQLIKNMKRISQKTKRMPSEFAVPIKEFLDSINLVSLSEAKRGKLVEMKERLESGQLAPENVLSRGELKELERIGRSDAKDFSLDELRQVHAAVKHYAHLAAEHNKLRIANRKMELKEAVEAIEKELKPVEEVKDNLIRTQKGRIARWIDSLGKMVDLFYHYQRAPDAILESLAGRDSVIYQVLFKRLNQGSKEAVAHRQRAQDMLADGLSGFKKRHNIGNIVRWLNQEVDVVLGEGKTIRMTRDERMSFYRHSLNADNRRAILDGGVGFRSSKQFRNRPLTLTGEQLDRITASMDAAEVEFAGDTITKLFDEQGRKVAEVYRKKNDLELLLVREYFPKDVLPREREAGDTDTEFDVEKFRNSFLRIGVEKDMTKERVDSKKAIYITGLMNEVNRSINRASAYIGLEIPISNAARLYYNKDFQNMIDERYGEKTRKYIEKYLRDMAGEMRTYDAMESAAIDVKNNLTVSYLGIRVGVMAKQVVSLPMYSTYIEPQYLLEGITRAAMHPVETKNRHEALSPYYRQRLAGASERDVADVFKSKALRQMIPDARKTLKEWGMSGIQLFDLAAVTPGMEAGVLKVMSEFDRGRLSSTVKETLGISDEDIAGMTPARKFELAYEYAEWVTEKTQPQFAPQFRSELSRGSALSKLLTMFGSFTNRAYNLLGSTYANARRTGKAEDWGIFARAAFNIMVVNTGIVLGINHLRDMFHDRELEDFWRGVLKSWSGYVFILRDAMYSVVSEEWYAATFETPIQSWIQGGIDSMRHLIKYLETGDEDNLTRAIDRGAEFMFHRVAIPYRAIMSLGESATDTEGGKRR